MRVGGGGLAYVEQGQGTSVVFVHGACSDHRVWEPQRESVARAFRHVALDQRYFGRAPWPDSGQGFSPQAQVEDLAAFVDGLGLGPVHLVGWSMSGATVLAVALQRPELVLSVFVYEPTLRGLVLDPVEAGRRDVDLAAMMAPAAQASEPATAARRFVDGVADHPGTFEAMPAPLQAMVLENARTLALQFAAPASTPVTCSELGAIRVPCVIVRGLRTRTCFRIVADATLASMPTARGIHVPRAGHLWPMQSPAAFNRLLLDVLGNGA